MHQSNVLELLLLQMLSCFEHALPLLGQYFCGAHWSYTDTTRKTGNPVLPRASVPVYLMTYGVLVGAAVVIGETPTAHTKCMKGTDATRTNSNFVLAWQHCHDSTAGNSVMLQYKRDIGFLAIHRWHAKSSARILGSIPLTTTDATVTGLLLPGAELTA